jgi:hypothetical protein
MCLMLCLPGFVSENRSHVSRETSIQLRNYSPASYRDLLEMFSVRRGMALISKAASNCYGVRIRSMIEASRLSLLQAQRIMR